MIAIRSTRRGATRLGVLAFASAAVVVIPTVAVAADGGTPTIRSTIGPDGAVKSTTQYTPDGTSTGYDGEQPITMQIGHTSSGASQTFSYHVENTFSETQTLNYFDTDGNTHRTSIELQLPLVAQLGVDVPKAMGAVTAPNAVITTTADGTRHVLWNLVLFTPLGSPVQDVTLTTAAAGTPVAELRATAVDPASTPGLSGSSQAASAGYQQDDFWATYASGANGGLTLIKDGLSQLLSGIVEGADGAQQLADGSAEAYAGSQDLSDGIGQIHDGQEELTGGLGKIHSGQGDLTDGLTQIHQGLNKTPEGLTGGLRLIHKGLGQLAPHGDQTNLQDAVDGLTKMQAGVQKILVGLVGTGGSASAPTEIAPGVPSILMGLTAHAPDVSVLGGGIDTLKYVSNQILTDAATIQGLLTTLATNDPATYAIVAPTLGPVVTDLFTNSLPIGSQQAPAGGILPQLIFAMDHPAGTLGDTDTGGLVQGLQAIALGLSHPATSVDDPGGINEGLALLLDADEGLPAAVDGLKQLYAGSGAALAGSRLLFAGTGDALDGSRQLTDGSGEALDGSQQLTDGSGEAFAGSQDLVDGLGQIADGQQQVADGLPAAVDGIGQLIDGVGQAQDDAVAPLMQQLKQDSINSHKQLAVIQAAAGLGSKGPGGAGATYVLTQSTRDFALAASTSGESHTGRNIGIGAGGVVLLLVGLGAGLAMGRRNSRVAA